LNCIEVTETKLEDEGQGWWFETTTKIGASRAQV